ncbi:MAG: AAA family ATPase [Bacteroidota bacterium]
MKLRVENLGPIKHAEIDLTKKFYVFVGYNNSGKTYMARLLSHLYSKAISGDSATIKEIAHLKRIEITRTLIDDTLKSTLINLKYSFASYLKIPETHPALINFKIRALDHDCAVQLLKNASLKWRIELNYIDGFTTFYYLKKEANSLMIEIDVYDSPESLSRLKVDWVRRHQMNHTYAERQQAVHNFNDRLNLEIRAFIKSIIFSVSNDFLPADRVFYTKFHKYVLTASKEALDMIASTNTNDLEAIRSISKNSLTADEDRIIQKLQRLTENSSRLDAHLDLIENLKSILGGEILNKDVKGISPVEFSLKTTEQKELDMYLASSTANQLALFYIYLKFWAIPKQNFLIIDEPEINLHPENQLQLLNLLMKFANRNDNKVLITTHSTLMADAVNNHLHLGYLKDKMGAQAVQQIIGKNELEIDLDAAMSHDDIGIYFFNGDRVVEYQIEDYGTTFRDFKQAEDKVKNTAFILKDVISEYKDQVEEYA